MEEADTKAKRLTYPKLVFLSEQEMDLKFLNKQLRTSFLDPGT